MKYKKFSKLYTICICPIIFSAALLIISSNNTLLIKNHYTEDQSSKKTALYPVNKNGQTYGPHINNSKEEPDLIAVYGSDGTFGYIKSTDLESPPSTPEEALRQQQSRKTPTALPVYDKEGEKIISTFILETNSVIDY